MVASLEFLKGFHQGVARGMDGGKLKRRLSEVNARAVSRGQNELSIKIFQFCFCVCVRVSVHRDFVLLRNQF